MKTVELGNQGLRVSAQGLGAMGMSAFYGSHDDAESIATLNRAVDLGVSLIDTAEAYGPFANEKLIARALGGRRDEVVLASKWGADFTNEGRFIRQDGSAEHARRAIERSLKHLNVDVIDLYYLHRVDPDVPIEESVGAMSDLVTAGKVRYLGISEAAPDTIRRAHSVHPLSAVQSEYSLFERGVERDDVLATVRELGIGFVAFSPLGRGFLSGQITTPDDLEPGDTRRRLPRFSAENIARNLEVVDRIAELAATKSTTSAQLALAWLMAQQVVPIAGTKRRHYLESNVAATDLQLDATDLQQLDALTAPGIVAGERDTPAGLSANYR